MGASGKTSNLQLPIYIGQDQPLYIPTFNDAMQKIDAGWATNKTAIENTALSRKETLCQRKLGKKKWRLC